MLPLPPRPTRKIGINPGSERLLYSVLLGQSILSGDEEHDIVRVDPPYVEPTWRMPAAGFYPSDASGDTLVLASALRMRGLHASTGQVSWTVGEDDSAWAAQGDRLYKVNPGITVADLATACVLGHFELPEPPAWRFDVCGEVLLLTGPEGADPIRAFDLGQGRILWERELRREVVGAAEGLSDRRSAIFITYYGSGQRAVIVCGKTLFGLSLADGRLLWHRPCWVNSGRPVIRDGRVYLWAKTPDGMESRLVCLDEATGEAVYDTLLPSYGEDFRAQDAGPASVAGELMAFAARRGLVAVFRTANGELVWSYRYKTRINFATLVENHLLATAEDGNLLVFEGRS